MDPKRSGRSFVIIRASEIGQYAFCSIAWQLQQEGYIPDSRGINKGARAHRSLGDTLDSLNHSVRLYQLCMKIAFIFFGVGIMVILGWMFL